MSAPVRRLPAVTSFQVVSRVSNRAIVERVKSSAGPWGATEDDFRKAYAALRAEGGNPLLDRAGLSMRRLNRLVLLRRRIPGVDDE